MSNPHHEVSLCSCDAVLLLQMNVSALEGELSRAMAQKAQTSAALSEALAVKLAAEQRLNSILVSQLHCFPPVTYIWYPAAGTYCPDQFSAVNMPDMYTRIATRECIKDLAIADCVSCPGDDFHLQTAKPVAAKLYAGATNASYQANATRDAAQQTLKNAQAKLSELQQTLMTAQGKKQSALGVLATVPGKLGAGQFKVGLIHKERI
jgi:hypothetical protein